MPTGLAVTAVDANNATDAALITNDLSFIFIPHFFGYKSPKGALLLTM
jgi:hypothetical protein